MQALEHERHQYDSPDSRGDYCSFLMDRPTTRTQQPVFLIIVRSLTVPPPLNLRLPNAHTHISLHLLLHDESGSTGSRVFYQPVHTHSINVSSQFDSMRSLVRGRNRIRMRVPSILFVSSSSSSTVELLASTHTNRHAHSPPMYSTFCFYHQPHALVFGVELPKDRILVCSPEVSSLCVRV